MLSPSPSQLYPWEHFRFCPHTCGYPRYNCWLHPWAAVKSISKTFHLFFMLLFFNQSVGLNCAFIITNSCCVAKHYSIPLMFVFKLSVDSKVSNKTKYVRIWGKWVWNNVQLQHFCLVKWCRQKNVSCDDSLCVNIIAVQRTHIKNDVIMGGCWVVTK